MGKRASEADQLRDSLHPMTGTARDRDTDDSEGAAQERSSRNKNQQKPEAEEVAVEAKRRKKEEKHSKKGKKNGSRKEELLKEFSHFDESKMKEFMKWQQEKEQERLGRPQSGAHTTDDPHRPRPSAPRGPGRFNLPKPKKRKTTGTRK